MKQLNHKPEHAPQHPLSFLFPSKKMGCILRPCLFLVSALHLMSQPSLRRKQLKEQYLCGIIHSLLCQVVRSILTVPLSILIIPDSLYFLKSSHREQVLSPFFSSCASSKEFLPAEENMYKAQDQHS